MSGLLFKLGNEVVWRSHRGIITEVVPAHKYPQTYEDSYMKCAFLNHGSYITAVAARDHESYVVSEYRYHKKWGTPLDTKTYWPIVSKLRKATK